MPEKKTDRLEVRVTPETTTQIADLARRWGGIHPLRITDVVVEAICRAWVEETGKKFRKKSD